MNTRLLDLSNILREAAPVRLPGHPQSAESVEREKDFAERSAQLARLRALRLQQAAPADTVRKPPKRTSK